MRLFSPNYFKYENFNRKKCLHMTKKIIYSGYKNCWQKKFCPTNEDYIVTNVICQNIRICKTSGTRSRINFTPMFPLELYLTNMMFRKRDSNVQIIFTNS